MRGRALAAAWPSPESSSSAGPGSQAVGTPSWTCAGGVALGIGWLAVCLIVVPPSETRPLAREPVLWALLRSWARSASCSSPALRPRAARDARPGLAARVAESMPAWLETCARPFSWLGGWIGLVGLGIAAGLVLALERAWRDLAFFLTAFVGSQLAVAVLKDGFDRPRPHQGRRYLLPDSSSFRAAMRRPASRASARSRSSRASGSRRSERARGCGPSPSRLARRSA